MLPPKLLLCVCGCARTLLPGAPPHTDGTPAWHSPFRRGRACGEVASAHPYAHGLQAIADLAQ